MRLFPPFLGDASRFERKKESTVVLKWFPQAIKVISLPQHVGDDVIFKAKRKEREAKSENPIFPHDFCHDDTEQKHLNSWPVCPVN